MVAGMGRVVVTQRQEWVFDNNVAIGEVFKAIEVMRQRAEGDGVDTRYDDWLRVEGDGEEIVLYYTVKETHR